MLITAFKPCFRGDLSMVVPLGFLSATSWINALAFSGVLPITLDATSSSSGSS